MSDKTMKIYRWLLQQGSLILLAALFSLATASTAFAHKAGEASGLRVVIIGATAKSANELIPQALWRGHEVVAVARRPYRVRHAPHPRLTILKGDVYNLDEMKAALQGGENEVVISVYGPRAGPNSVIPKTDLMSQGTTNIIEAMKAKGTKRLFVTSSTAVEALKKLGYKPETPRPEGLTPETGIWYYNMRGAYNDMIKMEGIALASGLDATVLRAGQLLVQPARGTLKYTSEDTPRRRQIMYADFAAFILDQAGSDELIGKTVGVYSDEEIDLGVNFDYESEAALLEAARLEAEADLAADAERAKQNE
jgi:nucleoside-diphosphate-sugar epimerase